MPLSKRLKKVKRKIESEARKKGLTGDRYRAYVYGTFSKIEKEHNSKRGARHGR